MSKRAFILLIILLVLISLIFIPLTSIKKSLIISNESEKSTSTFELSFYVNETKEILNGEVLVNNTSFGFTENGKIRLSKSKLNVSRFIFRTNYKNGNYSFNYDFFDYYLNFNNMEFTISEKYLSPYQIFFYFVDNKTNCGLNGDFYVDNKLFGKTEKSKLLLKEQDYKDKFRINSTAYIYGLTDNCFEKDVNLPFAEYWVLYDLQLYLDSNQNITFVLFLTPRKPKYLKEMQGFVRPDEVRGYFSKEMQKYFKSNNTEDNLDIITKYAISYISDFILFHQEDYWQTPAETIEMGAGDCEDWAVTSMSLILAYNNSVKCYDALWQTHMSIFCYVNGKFIIYDQERVKSGTALETNQKDRYLAEQENKIKIRHMMNSYFDSYGLEPDERKLYAIFNENELIIFNDNEEFVEWALKLI